MNVPCVDLKRQFASIKEELMAALLDVCENTAFVSGPYVAAFEQAFADYCGTDHAVGVNSGTSALWAALLALGVGPGDEVITVSHTFVATVEAIAACGATPVLIDIDEVTYTMNPELLGAALSPKTKAIIPVHLYGHTADMEPIMSFAREHGLAVIEDACQAHGAYYKDRRAGALGDAACFSFYPAKNLGACGEGGIVTTSNEVLVEPMRKLREHGQSEKYIHTTFGWNARMEGIQGATLNVKLKYLDQWNDARRAHAAYYAEQLADVSTLTLPLEAKWAHHVYHVYAVRHPQRDAFMKGMAAKGVYCGIHYPVPVHEQAGWQSAVKLPQLLPVTECVAREVVSLPMFPELTEAELVAVQEAIHSL